MMKRAYTFSTLLLTCIQLFWMHGIVGQEMLTTTELKPRQQVFPLDTTFVNGMPVMVLKEEFYDFGTITKGEKPSHTFEFYNRGTAPMRLDFVSACECTEIQWTKTLLYPGDKGHILATYDSTEKQGEQEVNIDIIAYKMLPGQEEPKEEEIILEQARFRVFVQEP